MYQSGQYRKEIQELQSGNIADLWEENAIAHSVISEFSAYFDGEISTANYESWFQSPAPVYLSAARGKENILINYFLEYQLPFEGERSIKTIHSPLINSLVENGICRIQDKGTAQSISGLTLSGNVWDCCCGAGGKSLSIAEEFPRANLYCSDKRASILYNLKQRFLLLGLPVPRTSEADLARANPEVIFENQNIPQHFFDVIVADVPCTGSGTWRHNPEAAHFFGEEKIEQYAAVQRSIVRNALPYLKPGGILIYLTCSVFDAENKSNAEKIRAENNLEFISQKYTGGYEEDCDYIFRAVLKKLA